MSFLTYISSWGATAVSKNIPPLTLPNGKELESIEQLRENADKDWLVSWFRSGLLGKWLNEMCYETQVQRVEEISGKATDELFMEVSDEIGLPNKEKQATHDAAVQRLSEYTKDLELLKLAECSAYSQKDMVELLKKVVENGRTC